MSAIQETWGTLGERWRSSPRQLHWALGIALLLFLIVLPYFTGAGSSFNDNATRALAYVVMALGLNIVVGFAGLLDLGYVAFFAIGA